MKKRLQTISTAVLATILILLGLLAIAGFALPRQTQQFPEYASEHASFDFERAAGSGFDASRRRFDVNAPISVPRCGKLCSIFQK
jgi:hypothetical protein